VGIFVHANLLEASVAPAVAIRPIGADCGGTASGPAAPLREAHPREQNDQSAERGDMNEIAHG